MQNGTSYARAVVLLLVMVLAPGSLLAQNPLEDVLPPDIMPIVVLSGSDYEMGYQYGQQAGQWNQLGQSSLTAGGNYQNTQSQMANQMFQNQYMPYQQMQGFGNQGMQNAQIRSGADQNMAGLLAQLGIGRSTADINYTNAESQNLVGLLRMLGGMGGGM